MSGKPRGLRYKYTSLEEQRRRIKKGLIQVDVRAYYDLFPEEWERQRKKIMRELE